MKILRLFTCLSLVLSTAGIQLDAQTLTFTTCGSSGRFGPTQGMADTEYGPGVVTVTGGIQSWSVPATGMYHIKACGARGGTVNSYSGGAGACMEGDFYLSVGQTVEIIVGQTGEDISYNTGGGGGSFVWISGSTTEPLIAAGGGGGAGLSNAGIDATITTSGTNGTGTLGTPGTGGFGATPGGAGWKSDGGNYTGSTSCAEKCTGGGTGVSHGGASPLTSIVYHGCAGTSQTGDGGFGGGGGGNGFCTSSYGGGGGGGYSGGAGQSGASQGGGGAGSYNAGLNQTNTASVQTGDGVVEITQLIPPSPHDAGISEFPSLNGGIVCAGATDVTATIQNYGIAELDSVFVEWTVNGVAPSPGVWVQLNGLDTVNGPDDDTTITLGSFNFMNGNSYVVKSWTSQPNGLTDTINTNDTNAVLFVPALSGTYFITPAGLPNTYASFTDAVNDLVTYGVCGPVEFIVDHATYNERVVIPEIPSMSSVNTVRFTGLNGVTSAVELTYTSTGSADNGVLYLDGADYFTFDHMTISNGSTSGSYAAVVNYENGAHYNTFDSLIILGNPSSTTTSQYSSCFISNGSVDTNNVISNCQIDGGSGGYYIRGNSTVDLEKNTKIWNNTFTNYYYRAGYAYYSDNMEVAYNMATPDPVTSYSFTKYGYYFGYAYGSPQIHHNKSVEDGYGYGIYCFACNGLNNDPAYIYNNDVSIGDATSTSSSTGVYFSSSNNVVFHSNSVNSTSNGSFTECVYLSGSNLNILSNNLVNDGPGYAIYISSGLGESDHNNFYAPNGYVGYASGAQTTLADLQAATGTDVNSVSTNPLFPAFDDLTTCNDTLDMGGISDTIVVDDYDGNLRASTPDIGAHEFDGVTNFTIGADTSICSQDTLILGNPASNSSWIWNTGSTANNIGVNTPGTYIAQITNVCGIGYDTATIAHLPDAIADFDFNSSYLTGVFTDVSSGADTWSWDFGDGGTSNSQNPLHVYQNGGTYVVSLTVTGTCGTSTFTDSVTVGVVGVNDINAIDFALYPNPTDGVFAITSSELSSGAIVELMDATGRRVYQTVMNANKLDLDVTSLESGIYLVRVQQDGKSTTKQLIIQ